MLAIRPRPDSEQPTDKTDDGTLAHPNAPKQRGMLADLLNRPTNVSTENMRVDGVLIGWLVAIDDNGTPMVAVPDLLPEPRPAVSLSPLLKTHVGAQCAVMFEGGNRSNPVLMGMLYHNVLTLSPAGGVKVQEDAESLCITHAKQISLHCGKASLRLTHDGHIELRGTKLISHSTGLNRVRGASVKLN